MGVPRYYRVIMGHRGDEAKTKFLDYLRRRGQERVGSRSNGRNRPEKIGLYITPFAFDLAATQRLPASAETPAWTRVQGVAAITARAIATLPTGTVALPMKKVKPARVIVKVGQQATGTDKPSHITGLTYKDYGGSSFSIPFGKGADTEEEAEARATIRDGLVAAGIAPRTKITFTDEDI